MSETFRLKSRTSGLKPETLREFPGTFRLKSRSSGLKSETKNIKYKQL